MRSHITAEIIASPIVGDF